MKEKSRKTRVTVVVAMVVGLVFAVPPVAWAKSSPGQTMNSHRDTSMQHDHQRIVAERGRKIMPFDLEKTTHIFTNQADGGLQRVVAKDPTNTEQIALIQAHLEEEAAKFSRGDFSDPEAIHGADMPGLSEVKAGASRIRIQYDALPNGAQIKYTTNDPKLIDAVHRWFAAQVSDHGNHASPDR